MRVRVLDAKSRMAMKRLTFHVLTAVPRVFDSYLGESVMKRARVRGIIDVRVHDLRDFSNQRHRTIDDRPFGGGPGMVLQLPPIYEAVEAVKRREKRGKRKVRVILFSTRGKKFDAKIAKRLSRYNRLILICGRYEGVDERVAKHIADEEISIGDYVLSGGELPALVLIETVSRFLPGFLGKKESLEEVKGSYPVYTRPAVFLPRDTRHGARAKGRSRGWRVPAVLLSGDHKRIQEWRSRR